MIRDQELLDQLLDTISRFVRERLIPNEARLAEDDAVPAEILEQMKEMGLFGLSIPEEFGGLGLTMEEEALVAMEIGKTSPAFRSVFGTNNGIGAQGILIDGTPEQKAKYVPRLATGEIISSFCLTEPDSGSDAASLRTTAIRDGDHYILNGTKRFKRIRVTVISVRLAWDRVPPTFAERAGYLDGKARGIPEKASFDLTTFLAKNYPGQEKEMFYKLKIRTEFQRIIGEYMMGKKFHFF